MISDIVFVWQVKQERALQEQASTYLQLVCSACDLSEARVRETAAAIQQIKLQVIQLQHALCTKDGSFHCLSLLLLPSAQTKYSVELILLSFFYD